MIDFDKIDAKCNSYLNSVGRSCSTILDVNEIKELVAYVRQAEKDAARYRWALDNCLLGIGRNGATWDLQFEGPAPDHIGQVSEAIDEAMKCK